VISQEIERGGIPTTIITTLVPTALMVGAHRIVPGQAITHPLGNPELLASQEKEMRRAIVLKALEALRDEVADKRVFNWS